VDQFYQDLRKIQKKERNNGTLARVEETFYTNLHEYMDRLRRQAIEDPFSNAHGILKNAQMIATDICERREKKITESAVVNIHRSYHLFTGKPQFDLVDTTPLNLTPEEERFYYSLIETLKNHRGNISLEKLSDEDDEISTETQNTTLVPPQESPKNDEVLERLDEISKAKPIVDEKPKPIEKQIADSKQPPAVDAKPKETIPKPSIEDNPNAGDETEEFYDLESQKLAKDMELVTMLVFDDVGAIVGVDEKVYGPFRPQDLVTLPMVNAKIFFKNRKGRQVKI
jgi:DNA replication factor GINS